MPAMTMVFRVRDAAMFDQVKPGDKVNFIAANTGSVFTVTKNEVSLWTHLHAAFGRPFVGIFAAIRPVTRFDARQWSIALGR